MTHPQRNSSTRAPSLDPLASLTRPTLLPGLRRLWRDRYHLQLGTDPARAVVLELPDPAAAGILDLLDGSRSVRAVMAVARRQGINESDARTLLTALQAAGLVVGARSLLPPTLPALIRQRLWEEAAALALRGAEPPGPDRPSRGPTPTPAAILRRRARARVLVTGPGRLATSIALTLARAGVGHVLPTRDAKRPTDSGAGRAAAPPEERDEQLAAQIHHAAPGTRTGLIPRRELDFAVLAGLTAPANLTAAGYARQRLPHLLISIRDGVPVVGPLVPPTGRPCLQCVELHRRDRDPDWSHVASQLLRPSDTPCAAATALGAAALAATDVLRWLDGERPATLGVSVEVHAPDQLRRRTWPPHPECHCSRRPLRGPL